MFDKYAYYIACAIGGFGIAMLGMFLDIDNPLEFMLFLVIGSVINATIWYLLLM